MLLADAMGAYVASLENKNKSKTYVNGTKTTLFKFRQLVGNPDVAEMDWPYEVERVSEVWIKAHKGSTVNTYRSHLKCFIDYCERRRYITITGDSVLDRAEFSQQKKKPREWIRLKPMGLMQIIDTARHPMDRMFIAIGVNTGMRRGEIQTLRIRDIWLDEMEFRKYDHKTGQLDAQFPINPDLAVLVREHLTWYAQRLQRQGMSLEPDMYLICAKEPGSVPGHLTADYNDTDLSPYHIRDHPEKIVKQCLKQMVNPKTGRNYTDDEIEHEGMHTLRRSAAMAMFRFYEQIGSSRNEALKMVQVTLGHSSMTMTEKYIGTDEFRDKRNELLKANGLLSSLLPSDENVTPLRKAR